MFLNLSLFMMGIDWGGLYENIEKEIPRMLT
jgi:hypothetical protein